MKNIIKLSLIVVASLLLISCGGENKQSTAKLSHPDPKEFPPPTDLEFTFSDHRTIKHPHQQPVISEEQSYQNSLSHIDRQMLNDNIELQMCETDFGKNSSEYRALLNKLCAVDVLLDSRSNRHPKQYCSH